MSFEDIMRKMLPVLMNNRYFPYITKSKSIPAIDDAERNDYDRIRDDGTFHGGVDILYYELLIDGTKKWLGSGNQPGTHPSVHAPVPGKAWNAGGGTVKILDKDGYVHTFRHMANINTNLSTNPASPTNINESDVLGKMSDVNAAPGAIHLHYEITTYYSPTVERYQKIDPWQVPGSGLRN